MWGGRRGGKGREGVILSIREEEKKNMNTEGSTGEMQKVEGKQK